MAFELRPYQRAAVDAAIAHVKKSLAPCLLELCTGAGKSALVSEIARFFAEVAPSKRILCMAPSRELVMQNHYRYTVDYGYPASVYCASAGSKCLRHQVIFASPQTAIKQIEKIAHMGVSAIIIDECFPGETLVSTPHGDKRIDQISEGDVVHCASGNGIVGSVFTRSSDTITVRTKHGKSFRCTPDHPIFTEKGFIKASELENGTRIFCREEVSMLFEPVQTENEDVKEWQHSLSRIGISMGQARMLLAILLKEMEEPNAQQRKQRENEVVFAENRSRASHKGWKWEAAKSSAALFMARAWAWVGNGASNKNSCWPSKWRLSELLQSGYRERKEKNSNRSGWLKSFGSRALVSRFQKRREIEGAWMDRVSHIERGRHEDVYNLRVGGHPSYFANGFLVHNCHGITDTMRNLIEAVRNYELNGKRINEKVRIIGMTATPYRLGTGYIYAIDGTGETDRTNDEGCARDPYYSRLVYRVQAGELVEAGFLSRAVVGESSDHYDTQNLKTDSFGRFSAASVSEVFDKSTKTEAITAKIMAMSTDRMGVIIFAATINHAEEIAGYLPPEQTCVITGKTPKKERESLINRFKSRQLKYLVNVAVLTTGFDAPHVDVVAIMRATESAALFQQMIGRSLRLHPDKESALILDYAENIERHGLQTDLFTPQIRTKKEGGEGVEIELTCPVCGYHSIAKRRCEPEYDGLKHDEFGNFLIHGTEVALEFDDDGLPCKWHGEVMTINVTDYGDKDDFGEGQNKILPMPAHYTRRCKNDRARVVDGMPQECDHRYTLKHCPECNTENDIAARQCVSCKTRLVDPNEKLTRVAGDSVSIAVGESVIVDCMGIKCKPHVGATGKHSLRVTYHTAAGHITAYHTQKQHWIFKSMCYSNGMEPETIDPDYANCAGWTAPPKTVKIKKTEADGFSRLEIKEVHYL